MMNTLRVFRSPRDIVWGRGTFSHLREIPGKRVLIVTDRVMTKLGVTARAIDSFRKVVWRQGFLMKWSRSL